MNRLLYAVVLCLCLSVAGHVWAVSRALEQTARYQTELEKMRAENHQLKLRLQEGR